jgi:valyl-tRNA synthetase
MPFITEELWTSFTGGQTLMRAAWPVSEDAHINKSAEKVITQLQDVITEVRRFRNDQGVKPTQKIPGRFIAPAEVARYQSAMAFLLKLELGDFTPSASVEIGTIKCELDLSGTVDIVAEKARLEKDLATAKKDLATADTKLSNEGFMAKAPANVLAEIRERQAATTADIERISAQLAALK